MEDKKSVIKYVRIINYYQLFYTILKESIHYNSDLSISVYHRISDTVTLLSYIYIQNVDQYLHSTSQSKYQVESRLLLDVVIRQGSAIF